MRKRRMSGGRRKKERKAHLSEQGVGAEAAIPVEEERRPLLLRVGWRNPEEGGRRARGAPPPLVSVEEERRCASDSRTQ